MNRAAFLFASAIALATSAGAVADDTCAPREPHVQCLRPVTIYGHPPKPMVVIELRHPSASTAAGAAHEAMRARWLKALVPATLRRD